MQRSLAFALGIGVAFVLLVSWRNWAGTDVTGDVLLTTLVVGVTLAAIYAMYAAGIVVVYTTTGIFNFAQGAIGAFGAFLYWELHVNRGWHTLLSIFFVCCVALPLIGAVLDLVIMRQLQGSPLVLQLMVTVGLMLLFLGVTANIWTPESPRSVPAFYGTDGFDLGPIVVSWHRFITVIVAVGLALALRVLLFRTRLGVAMRAVVDNRNLAALNGARPALISATAWGIGCGLAGLAGILIAPGQEFNPENLNIIIIIAFAAAAFGQLRSLPLTLVGCLVLGLGRAYSQSFLRFGSDFPQASNALAPILLFIVVLALPQARLEVGRTVRNLRRFERHTKVPEAVFGMVVLFLVVYLWTDGFTQANQNRTAQAMYTAIIVLSLVPLTGWAGQVNFAPLAFAGFGAYLFRVLAGDSGNVLWLPLVALLCAPLGALVALPASRLKGLYLALASMAFAHGMAVLFFPHPDVFPDAAGQGQFEPFELFGWSFATRVRLILFLTVCFALILIGLTALRRSSLGRRWVAFNDSPAACATVGINVRQTTVAIYALSAAIAGFGGAGMAVQRGTLQELDFDLIRGLPYVLLGAVGGLAYPIAGLFAGVSTILFIVVKENWDYSIFDALEIVGPGLMAVGMVANQSGAVHEIGRGFAPLLPWRSDARQEARRERAQKREPEIGELGLVRPFTSEAVVDLDRRLGILGEVGPPGGYGAVAPGNGHRDEAPPGGAGRRGEEAGVGAPAGS
jgi:branched-chain amino acid transport system permease protein